MTQQDFEFTKDELILLANIQYTALSAESNIDEFSHIHSKSIVNFFSFKETKEETKKELLKLKSEWVSNWQETTWKLLDIPSQPYSHDLLMSSLSEFNSNSTYDKKVIFALECASFSAYYPLVEGDTKLDFDEKEYLKRLEDVLIDMYLPNNALVNLRNYYEKYLKKVSNELKTAFQKYSILIAAVGGVAALALLTPFIAAGIGGLMGLSGAAASSAGLALLGGGSLAAGGLGMAGGTFVLLGGGALAGYVGGKAISDKDLEGLKSENLVISSAKLLSVTKLLAENKKINFKDIYKFLESLRNMQFKFEENLDQFVCLTETLDLEKYNNYKNNALIIDYSRKTMLELLIDNKD